MLQGGLDYAPRGQRPALDAPVGPMRAVVLATRVDGDADHVRGLGVECDVLLVRSNITIAGVPVLQRNYGVNNAQLWQPRPTTRTIDAAAPPLNVSGSTADSGFAGPVSSLGSLDGDHVLVDFLEGNKDFPIIIGALPHERSNRATVAGSGWVEGSAAERGTAYLDEHYVHHAGAEIRVNAGGDVLIDTVGAYDDPTTEDASAQTGQVRVRVKDSQRFTLAMGDDEDVLEVWKDGGQLRIDLGESADQRLVLGDDQVTALKALIDALDAFTQTIATAAPAPPNAALTVAAVLAAQQVLKPQLEQAKTALEQALSEVAKTKRQ